MKVHFLGTSDSEGIPVHNCSCSICQKYRKQKKINLATCAYIESLNGEILLLDAGIENLANIFDGKKIKAVLLTHFHPDHSLGLLRLRYSADVIDCYHPQDPLGFADLFKHKQSIRYHPSIPFATFQINEFFITPIPLQHSKNTTGYLIETKQKTIAYLTDCMGIEKPSMDFLLSKSIDICYLDACLAPNSLRTNHLDFYEASDLLDKIQAKQSFLIHGSHHTLRYIQENNITLKYPYL